MSDIGPLSALAKKYGSDKWGSHNYTLHYEAHFAAFRDQEINLLEIGIGGYEDQSGGGESLKMWNDYFPRASIFALDLYDKQAHATKRIKIYQGRQNDRELLQAISAEAGGFNIIIDDGSHYSADVITSFNVLFPLLREGGLYVVEDTQASYWSHFGGCHINIDSPQYTMGFFKSLVHGLNHAEIPQPVYAPSYFDLNITSLHFYHNLVFVGKGDNSKPSNFDPDHPIRRVVF